MAGCDQSPRAGGAGFRAFADGQQALKKRWQGKEVGPLGDWGFWVAVAVMSLAVAASLIATVLQRRHRDMGAAAPDVQVYRAQLAEVARDLAAGRVAAPDADRLRIEISRRILAADQQAHAAVVAAPVGRFSQVLMAGLIAVVVLGAAALYTRLGAPGYGDLPLSARLDASAAYRATRPKQAVAEAATTLPQPPVPDAEFAALMATLRQAVVDRPGDLQGLALLARNEAALGNLAAARDAQVALIAAKTAPLGSDHAELAEMMIALAGGYVSPEAEAELIRALQLDPGNGTALYYSGLMFAQGDRADQAFAIWRGLLDTSPPGAPWVGSIRASIGDLAARAGVDYVLPEASGPTGADVAAAAEMPAADQRAMIESMVDGLSDRLAEDGGPAEDWARLITSLGVLGDLPRATAIYAEAQARFAGRAADMEALRLAAVAAGIAE